MGYFSTVGAAIGELAEHADSEATRSVASATTGNTYYSLVSAGSTVVSASITITKRSLIVVVSLAAIEQYSNKKTDIQRGGVNKTKETTVSPLHFAVISTYGHLQYATEILNPGTYTYNLVVTSGPINCYGAAIKIVAVTLG
jgi:hypothetical protein